MLRHQERSLSGKLQDIAADVLAYIFMVVFLPVITALAYLATTGMKPGWKWIFRLFRIWIAVCCAPFVKLRQILKDG